MGTRGITGFVIDGEVKASYQQFDSYPSGVGDDVVKFIKSGQLDKEKVRAIRMVTDDDPVTEDDIERLRKYADTHVSTGALTEWYVLLRECQGDPARMQEAGVMLDCQEFWKDSLFCEYGYLVNCDTDKLEFYVGFQKWDRGLGRFAGTGVRETAISGDYYPIALAAEYDFDALPGDGDVKWVGEDEDEEALPF